MLRFVSSALLGVAVQALPSASTSYPLPPSFGAFGYPSPYSFALIRCDEVSVTLPGGRRIQFAPETSDWSVQRLSCFDKVLSYRPQAGYPIRARLDTASNSVSLEYRDGFVLSGSGSAPFVSWSEASAGPGVPTPPVRWVALSWSEGGPVVLLRFAGPAGVTVEEDGGTWTLRSNGTYSGWVHLWLPLGSESVVTRSASDLGRLVARIAAGAERLEDVPRVVGWQVDVDDRGVSANWQFDRPGSLIPSACLVEDNRLRIKVLSKATHLGTTSAMRIDEANLRIRFVARKLLSGRAVTTGDRSYESFSLDDPAGIFEATVAYLWNRLSPEDERVLRASVQNWRAGLPNAREPFTGLRWPGGRSRQALREFAAFSMADLALFGRTEGVEALAAALDWTSWTLSADADGQFATGVLAIAGALAESPSLRATGAVAAAGLRGVGGSDAFAPLLDGLYPIASVLDLPPPSWLRAGLSPVRLVGGENVEVRQSADGTLIIESLAPGAGPLRLTLASVGECEVHSKFNLEAPTFALSGNDLTISLQVRRAGYLKLALKPKKSFACPPSAPSPRYNAGQRSPSERAPAPR